MRNRQVLHYQILTATGEAILLLPSASSTTLMSHYDDRQNNPIIPVPAAAPSAFHPSLAISGAHSAATLTESDLNSPPPAAVLAPLPLFPKFGNGHWGIISILGPDKQHIGYFGRPTGSLAWRPPGACQEIANAVQVYFAPWESTHRLQCKVRTPYHTPFCCI